MSRRDEILSVAMDVASSEGLEGITIGRLSKAVGMSKSGLFAHFGSKEDLQTSTVDFAQERFRTEVWDRVSERLPGIVRLRWMLRTWIAHIEGCGLSGGCFFSAAAAEFDGRPGAVQDRLVLLIRSWVDYLSQEIETSMEMGQIERGLSLERTTFQLHALVQESNLYRQLFDREDAFDLARDSIDAQLAVIATEKGKKLLMDEMESAK